MNAIIEWWDNREFKELYIISACIIVITTLFAFDMTGSDTEVRIGTIYDESFSPDNQTTTTGMAITPKGAVPVIAHSGHSDEWYVIIKYSETEYEKVRVSLSQYCFLKKGKEVMVKNYYGKWTGINYATRIAN